MIMSDRKSTFFRPLLWAATLAIGFGTLWAVLAGWLGAAIDGARKAAVGDTDSWEQLVVRSDGTPLIMRTSRANLSMSTYRDLSGRAQEAPDQDHRIWGVYMPGEDWKPRFFAGQLGWERRLKIFFVNEQEPAVLWYFVHDGKPEGAGYFVGYEQVSNRRVGFIGLLGFRSQAVPIDEWIPVRTPLITDRANWNSAPNSINWGSRWAGQLRPDRWDLPPRLVHVPSGNRLRLVDLATGTVKTVFEAPEPIESLGVPELSSQARGRPEKEQPILVRTGQQIHSLNHNYQITRVFTIPPQVEGRTWVTCYELGNGQALVEVQQPRGDRDSLNIAPGMMYRVAADGTIQDHFEVILQNPNLMSREAEGFLLALVVPVPAILIVIEPLFLMDVDQARSYPAALGAVLKLSWPSLLPVFALTLVLAVVTKRRCSGFGLSKREQLVWTVFVLLFGFPAYMGFLLYRRWPIRQPCPNCHARAPRDRVACAECGTRFPDPALKGIEIFA
jgi:hypothetical protein